VDFVGANPSFGRVTRDAQGRMVYWTDEQRSQFKFPAAGTAGTAGRNAFYGPGFWNVNLAIYKNFPVKEELRVQFRSEFFNVFNHPVMQLDSPTALGTSPLNFSNPNFGRFQTQRNDPRTIQFALRVDF
jgi:hypothetical protein